MALRKIKTEPRGAKAPTAAPGTGPMYYLASTHRPCSLCGEIDAGVPSLLLREKTGAPIIATICRPCVASYTALFQRVSDNPRTESSLTHLERLSNLSVDLAHGTKEPSYASDSEMQDWVDEILKLNAGVTMGSRLPSRRPAPHEVAEPDLDADVEEFHPGGPRAV